MALFGGKKGEGAAAGDAGIVGFTKSKKFLFLKVKSKPLFGGDASAKPAAAPLLPGAPKQEMGGAPAASGVNYKRPNRLQMYFASTASKYKDLEGALRALGIKDAPYVFVRRMFVNTLIICAVVSIAICALLLYVGLGVESFLFAGAIGVALYMSLFNRFIRYPMDRSKIEGKDIEKDILFAARDLVISMRSGMPFFNAMAAVSTGYGAASKEFAKVVELIQLGTPTEQAIDDISAKSQSKTFKRIMLQASVSIKVGADIVGALQGVVDEVMQERIIDLRRYGQRLNALAMFYLLFGVIFPSMGIAVAAILTTFINIFSITGTTLIGVLVFIFFLQIIFLNIMRSSRPVFAL
ncbi:Type II secretion system (T2SS), protein F [uncultured archaeon]|nr:Type II secretion system (T2SS), protein F [uncultured archaeon]